MRKSDPFWLSLAFLYTVLLALGVRRHDWVAVPTDVLILLGLPALRAATRYRP